ncbi:MAG: tellurium resistance protein [Paracoccaceae bacterium]|nr:tellurium resistance protein [Paracoccaceae bacterium]
MAFKPPVSAGASGWRRTPPAIFPSVLGLFGLGLGWRKGVEVFGVPAGFAEIILGAVSLLFVFGLGAYILKLFGRPTVIVEELRILPGRAGLAAMVLSLYLFVLVLQPYVADLVGFFYGSLICHGVLVLLLIWVFATGPAEQRRVTPIWHLSFVGFIIAALAAVQLGLGPLSLILFAITVLLAAAIWSVSAERLFTERTPAPLRPLMAIHLSPAALFGLVAYAQDLELLAWGFAMLSAILMAAMIVRLRWLTEAGFTALWGAFTFPLAATANLWLTVGGVWLYPGMIALTFATGIVPWIAFRVMKLWASGRLATLTNSATA